MTQLPSPHHLHHWSISFCFSSFYLFNSFLTFFSLRFLSIISMSTTQLSSQTGSTNQVSEPSKRTGQMIEPSKVVVFPDSAVRGTDIRNMQIKEFHPKNGHGKWLAVHIPDRMSYPRKNMKIIASKKVAKELQRVVGPNQDTLAREIQSILGVDEKTLQKMIVEGQQKDDANMEGDDDDDDDESEDEDDDEENDNDDDEDDEEETPGDGYFNDGKLTEKKHKKKFGSGVEDEIDNPTVHVEQPEGFELRWEDILNNFKNFNLKRRKKICKLFALHNNRCHKEKKRKHGFRRKLKHYLLRMLRKFLKSNKNDFENYLSSKLKDALAGRLKPSDDGLLHIYSKNSGNMNMEDFLKDLTDGSQTRLGALSQSSSNQDPLTVDDDTVSGGVFKVTQQMNKLADEEGQEPPSDAISALNNIIHPLLNDQDNKMDEKLQTKILREELGKYFKAGFSQAHKRTSASRHTQTCSADAVRRTLIISTFRQENFQQKAGAYYKHLTAPAYVGLCLCASENQQPKDAKNSSEIEIRYVTILIFLSSFPNKITGLY